MDGSGDDDPQGEATLLAAARTGDRDAYARLFQRHRDAARRYAVGLVGDEIRADDLVGDAFAKVMIRLDAGAGPTDSFRAYLFTTIRNSMIDNARREARERVGDLQDEADLLPNAEPSDVIVETSVVMQALLRLPPRWREALWYSEVHKESQEELAARFGIKPNAAGVLCYRARERLRQAYLAEYIARSPTPDCARHSANIPAHIRGQLSARRTQQLEAHLSTCRHCTAAVEELAQVNAHLGGLVAPALLLAATQYGGIAGLVGHAAGPITGQVTGGSSGHSAGIATTAKTALTGVAVTALLAAAAVGLWTLTRAGGDPAARAPSTSTPSPTRRTPPGAAAPPRSPSTLATPRSTPESTPESTSGGRTPSARPSAGKRGLHLPAPLTGAVRSDQAAVAVVTIGATSELGRVRLSVALTNVTGYRVTQGAGAWSCHQVAHGDVTLRLRCRSTGSPAVEGQTLGLTGRVAHAGTEVSGTVRASDGRTSERREFTIRTATD